MGCSKGYRVLTVELVFLVLVFYLMMSWPEPVTRWIPQPLPAAAYVSESVNWDSLPQELTNLTSLLYWPPTGGHNSDFLASTSPKTSTYHLAGPAQATYILGSNLEAILVARDHWGRPKAHGGDLFRAQLLGPELKAGVPGEVKDLENGTYLLSFPLLWAGRAQVQVRLIHSSEAVGVLRRVWRETRATVDFRGYFQGTNGIQEVVTCNVDPQSTGARGPTCQYKDVVSGEIWFCAQPPTLPCSALVGHSSGRYLKVTTPHDELLLAGNVTDQKLPSGIAAFLVTPAEPGNRNDMGQKLTWLAYSVLRFEPKASNILALPSRPPCHPGHLSLKPSGFYHQDRWHSTFCSSRSFPTADSILSCLAGRMVYMMGDSTLRQWWEYLRDTVPWMKLRPSGLHNFQLMSHLTSHTTLALKPVDLHVTYQAGPLMAVETTRGTVLHWRAHSWPLRSLRTPVASLHSVARELHGLAGGPYTVVVLGMGAHFTTFPPSVFTRRLAGIRKAVKALLDRAPSTLVVIKLANTGYKSVYGSDWLTLQVNRLLRAAFVGLRVAFVDAWEMTSSLALPDSIHPGRLIVRNEVDLLLSFICPT
ncbi:NXPE family member 3-like isoform X4 [Meriones unguiculatus]|uniref:NXPE family member 3-like isoform X4 n=1 Tax=Meriones unguiculatus TaxID=10047 RepID=UPI00293E5AE9|nr:NXPE family member 3-like isoform X4 [Meriones unguiculatus]